MATKNYPDHQDDKEIAPAKSQKVESNKNSRKYTKSEATLVRYKNIIEALWFYTNYKNSPDNCFSTVDCPTPTDLVNDLFGRRELTKNTIISYSYALQWYFEKNMLVQDFVDAQERLNELLFQSNFRKKPNISNRAKGAISNLKKPIPQEDLSLIIEQLDKKSANRRTPWASHTKNFLLAGLATGVAPREWLHAEWVDPERSSIRITTNKMKVAKPKFLAREKPVTDPILIMKTKVIPISLESDRIAIELHMQTIREIVIDGKMSFKHFRDNCGRALSRACEVIWENRKWYSLYSKRDQLSPALRAMFKG